MARSRSSELARFERDLQREFDTILEHDSKIAVDDLALEIRQAAEEITQSVGAVKSGAFKDGWMAGPGVDKTVVRGGDGPARAALARRRPEENAFIYNNDFKGWWIENGFHDRAGNFHGPRPVLRAAVERVRDRVIRL